MRREIWWLLVSLIAAAAMGLGITRGEVDAPKPTPTASKVASGSVNLVLPMPTNVSIGVTGGPKPVWRRNAFVEPQIVWPRQGGCVAPQPRIINR